jgi:hypothetical protein
MHADRLQKSGKNHHQWEGRIMAKRKKRSKAQQRKPRKSKSARGKSTKRTKRAAVKKARRKKVQRTKQPTPAVETNIVDLIEEPAPGVITVTELRKRGYLRGATNERRVKAFSL